MRKIFATAAIAGLAGLTACAPSSPAPASTTAAATPTSSAAGTAKATPSKSSGTAAAAGGVKEACELFNTLYADYADYKAAVPDNEPNAYEDIYLKSEDAKDTAPRDVVSLFAALSLLAIDHSAAAGSGGGPEQASKDAVRDAVFGQAGTACTAEDVTLRL